MKIKSILKSIVIIGTGGTISGVGETGKTVSYKAGSLHVHDIYYNITGINELANIKEHIDIVSIDSCNMDFSVWLKLTRTINDLSKNDDIDGFVITHGTDTLEETAYFLNLTLKTDKPVVITGAIRPSTATSADGPFNIYQAVALARSEEAKGKGVLVSFADGIYGARDVQKGNSCKLTAFNHRELGCFGYIRDDDVYFFNKSLRKHTVSTIFNVENYKDLPKVSIALFYAGADSRILDYLSSTSQGIIVAGAGCGNCSDSWNLKIKEIIAMGIPVVRCSRISNGIVTGKNENILETGIYGNSLTAQKARILLSLALTKTKNLSEIKEIFNIY